MKVSKRSRWGAKTTLRLLVALATIGAGGALIALTGGVSSATTVPHKTSTVTLQFWNAYNDVTETPVMNGIVIPAFESCEPGHQGQGRHPSLHGASGEVHRSLRGGGPARPDAFRHRLGAPARIRGHAARNLKAAVVRADQGSS